MNCRMIWAGPIISMLLFFACEGRSTLVASEAEKAAAGTVTPTTSSQNPDSLLQEMQKLAASTNPQDQKKLLEFLSSIEAIYRLDPREDHIRKPVNKLRLAQLYQTIRGNDSAPMRETLAALVRSGKPINCDACDTMLIKALAIVRPPTAEVLKFWETHSDPDSVHIKFVIDALADNGTAPAIGLLEKRMVDATIAPEQKIAWMHEAILQHRRNPVLLASLDRILTTTLPKQLRPHLVESLFDYRPQDWYRVDANVPTPDSQPLTSEARRLLKKIGTTALKKVSLNASQRQAVTKAMREL